MAACCPCPACKSPERTRTCTHPAHPAHSTPSGKAATKRTVAAAQALWHYTLIRRRHRAGCFTAFRANHWLGFAVFAGTVVDLALR